MVPKFVMQHAFGDLASLEDAVSRESTELLTLNDTTFDRATDAFMSSMTAEVPTIAVAKVKSAAVRSIGACCERSLF
jgi:hypothetical protein